ncbi:MAG: DNA repair protein RadC [Proteobacteria bacterium]|nr:DNA repair protein RadC [Pseudomonadota bacterium]MBU1639832.1 DNA repair protein RadC [Pseudomonadota bacterium]
MTDQNNHGHRQRLRDKYNNLGLSALTDDEVLELLLTLGTPRKGCKETARALLKECGSLAEVLEATPDRLQQVKGVGQQNSFALGFIHDVSRRFLNQRLISRNYLRSSREVADYLNHTMRHLSKEVFKVIYLDSAFAIIDTEILFEGTLASNTIYPRELVKATLARDAAALVIAHNHPSGTCHPSEADQALTRTLFQACALLDIRLLDHLIIGSDSKPYSFADHGQMAEIDQQWQASR